MSRETSLVIGRCWSWSSEQKGSKGKTSLECIPGKGVRARIFGKESWSVETGLVIDRQVQESELRFRPRALAHSRLTPGP